VIRIQSKRGFLLLEVMVSIVVITAGLLFVMRVYSTAKLGLERSRSFFKYSLLLEEKMFDFEERGVIEEGKESGQFKDAKGCSWAVAATPLDIQAQSLGDLCSVRLDVSKDKEAYALFTYLNRKK